MNPITTYSPKHFTDLFVAELTALLSAQPMSTLEIRLHFSLPAGLPLADALRTLGYVQPEAGLYGNAEAKWVRNT